MRRKLQGLVTIFRLVKKARSPEAEHWRDASGTRQALQGLVSLFEVVR
jgi:hypothetical protein